MNSKRKYIIAFIQGDAQIVSPPIQLVDIVNHEEGSWEYLYAINDRLDEVLDLKVGERLNMNFNRDNEDSFGTLKRIQ